LQVFLNEPLVIAAAVQYLKEDQLLSIESLINKKL